MKKIHILLIVLSFLGVLDAGYLTYEHYANIIPPCEVNAFLSDCGAVLRSEYSVIFGIPLALIGTLHYSLIFVFLLIAFFKRQKIAIFAVLILSTIGLVSSAIFVYLMLFVIKSICLYCFISAFICLLLFIGIQRQFIHERRYLLLIIFNYFYKYLVKNILFRFQPETIHVCMVAFGQQLGKVDLIKKFTSLIFNNHNKILAQRIAGIKFKSPIGLAAGFDYEAQLTQILPAIGFGFQTVGTITNYPYQGNPRPMLGRLPKSQALMVNKGFKNPGAEKTVEKLESLHFKIPVGVSIGRTNMRELVTQKQSVDDIIKTFKLFEKSQVKHSYYELNISCPNLFGNISFYPPKNLDELLTNLDKLKIKQPIFIKMPIEKSDREVLAMLKIIVKHKITGVIFGNLQKNRNHPSLVKEEVKKFTVGNFSGKPTFDRSNELISLTYKHYKNKLIIIGCGGVFSALDAYEKITRGANLVQLITGMIFEGPQLIAQINNELPELLRINGFKSIAEAVGTQA